MDSAISSTYASSFSTNLSKISTEGVGRRTRNSVFLGETTKGSLSTTRFLTIQSPKSFIPKNGAEHNVLTSGINDYQDSTVLNSNIIKRGEKITFLLIFFFFCFFDYRHFKRDPILRLQKQTQKV